MTGKSRQRWVGRWTCVREWNVMPVMPVERDRCGACACVIKRRRARMAFAAPVSSAGAGECEHLRDSITQTAFISLLSSHAVAAASAPPSPMNAVSTLILRASSPALAADTEPSRPSRRACSAAK